MKRHLAIIVATVLVVLAVVFLTLHLHHESKMEVLSEFQDHQLGHAQHLVHQIKFFFDDRSHELQALSSLVSHEPGDLKKKKTAVDTCSKMMEYAQTISLCNRMGRIVYSTDSNAAGLDQSDREFFSWAKKKENKGKVSSSSLFQPDPLIFLLAVPLYRDFSNAGHPQPDGEFEGVLTVTVDLKEFLADQLDFLGTGMNLHQVWIMDSTGKLLFHSEHRDMVGRSIYQRDEKCQQCHTPFDHAEKILKARQGTVDYKLKGFPRKIAVFAPMNFKDMSWLVVVNSSYDEVTAVVKKNLWEFLALLSIVVSAAILGSTSIIRTDRFKVKAEEEVKHWREKRMLEDKIQQSEALYRTIVENAHDAICALDTEGNFTFVNRSGEEMSGYTLPELAGKNFASFIHPEDFPRAKDLLLKTLEGKSHGEDFEARFYAKDGTIHLLSVNSVPLYKNGSVIGLFTIARDITEHREAEKALQKSQTELQYLSSQLLTAEETERRRISKELHDELGQALTAIKLQVSFIEKGLKQDQVAIKEECESTSKYVDQVIEEVRRLSRDLTPSILEDAGLLIAIRWLISNFNKNHNINVTMTMDVADIDDLFSQNAQITIYRILQEVLTNIGKHAQAKNVSVTTKKEADRVFFTVEDDGIGFDMSRVAMINPSQKGLGLAILEERARMLGGFFQIWSEKRKGTRISFSVPLEKGGSV